MQWPKAKVNLKFVARGVLVGVPATCLFALIGFAIILPQTQLGSPPDPTPLPPTIALPRAEMPPGPVGLKEYAQYRGSEYVPVGSGFILKLGSGDLVGVTTAHSVALGDPDRPLDRIALRIPGGPGYAAEFGRLYGMPGRPMDGPDLSIDYVLLLVDGPVDPTLVLTPDPRGGPQPGERVSLFSGTGGGPGERYELSGIVQPAVDERISLCQPPHRSGRGHGHRCLTAPPQADPTPLPGDGGHASHWLDRQKGKRRRLVSCHRHLSAVSRTLVACLTAAHNSPLQVRCDALGPIVAV